MRKIQGADGETSESRSMEADCCKLRTRADHSQEVARNAAHPGFAPSLAARHVAWKATRDAKKHHCIGQAC
jgi:hypothetical protein